ncbi:Phosphatidylinositol 4-kinase [Handroanthus impetiginosus]|uniref:1-phosphatidylinositol 4-kinase n=1 Tax=Handroanthus impetiginosus TaxID=429701 RepID=A0A2G9HQS2_9LAMI|nr:Phosphatidylinositol 4-kinase [Handroanthus impetiginosus]
MLGQPGIKSSIRIGETGLRESAAYLLDHGGFSGVPPTALVKFSQVKFNINSSGSDSSPPYKIASLQRFVNHDSDAGDLGPSSFSVISVHHIGILDVRLMNLDRHSGNILVRRGKEGYNGEKAELVPIDHGFCLPESLDDPYFEWLHWPQASIPFSEAEVDYISRLDPYKDAEMLRTELPLIRESSIRILVLCTIFLKQATAYGLCIADIGEMMTREFHGGEANWSSLEKLCISAKARLSKGLLDEHPQLQTSLTESKKSESPRFPSMNASESIKKEHYLANEKKVLDNPKCLVRSLSLPPQNYNPNGEAVSFGDMDDKEWQSFLEIFVKLLPKAFEERKSMAFQCKNACR